VSVTQAASLPKTDSVRKRRLPRPRSAAGQIALLVVTAILAAHVLATIGVLAMQEPWRAEGRPGVAAGRLSTVARLLDASEPGERPALLIAAARSLPTLHLAPWDGAAPPIPSDEPSLANHPLVERLRLGFGQPLKVSDLAPPPPRGTTPETLHLGLETPGGARLQATLPDDPLRPPAIGAIVFTFLFLGLTLTLLSVWATRALTAPLARLAGAAEAFGTMHEPVGLPERGPREVVAVAHALDRMRARVKRLIDDRTQMLAAISHDLRTPITRLRLRAEFIEDEQARAMTLRDLNQMNGLVEAALSYVRDGGGAGGSTPTQMPLIDLASVAQTVCDSFQDVGADVRMETARHALLRGRPDELERAITNLVDNAVKYSGAARLSVRSGPLGIRVAVEDDGPGIPESEHGAMLEPFVRGDASRNLHGTVGFGLGLSIVRAVVEAHGGRFSLANRPEGGLSARIDLPMAAPPPRGPKAEVRQMPAV